MSSYKRLIRFATLIRQPIRNKYVTKGLSISAAVPNFRKFRLLHVSFRGLNTIVKSPVTIYY